MTTPAPVGLDPIALTELDRLSEIITAHDDAARAQWVTEHSVHTRTRERGLVMLLAWGAARGIEDGSATYRLELPDDAPAAVAMSGRLVTATLNQDHATTDALVHAWTTAPVETRAAVLEQLLGAMWRTGRTER